MKETIITKEIELDLNKGNAKRLQNIDVVILAIIALQTLSYILGESSGFGVELIYVKIAILIGGTLALFVLQALRKNVSFLTKNSSLVIVLLSVFMIMLAILNTFAAQQISNDISIYMFVQMAILASIRTKPKYTLLILFPTYIFFAVGMAFFQTNPDYLTSHLFNGALNNVLGLIISIMFYHQSLKNIVDNNDIDEKNKMLKKLSEEDFLTGLYNKRSMYQYLERFISEADINKNSIHLVLLDLDHFKNINDLYGHLYGDEVLKSVGQKIKEHIRTSDIASRYGGDEFVVIFRDTDDEWLTSTMKRILHEVSQLDFKSKQLYFSCGIASWHGECAEELFERADQLMYDVKREGKNNIKKE